MKEALACQAEKEVNSSKKKLEVAQQKAKDTTDDLQDVVDSTFVWSLRCYLRASFLSLLDFDL
jgi:hypothetical protein